MVLILFHRCIDSSDKTAKSPVHVTADNDVNTFIDIADKLNILK